MLARHEEYCSASVSEVMKPDSGQPGPLQEGLEVMAQGVCAAHGCARRGREHEPVIIPDGAHLTLLILACAVASEGFCGLLRAFHGATLTVLWASRICARFSSPRECALLVPSRRFR